MGSDRIRITWALALLVVLAGCGGGGSGDDLFLPVYAPAAPLTALEVDILVRRAAAAIDAPHTTVAVVDRVGRPLAVWRRDPATSADDVNVALSLARTGAFMSSSQGPISSRTLEFLSTFHFPAVFDLPTRMPVPGQPFTLDATLAAQRATTGVAGTPQGPLWQIFASNRGAPLAGADLVAAGGQTVPTTDWAPPSNGFGDMRIPPAGRLDVATGLPDPTAPGAGLTYLPGGVPIYKRGDLVSGPHDVLARVVGGIGVLVTDPVTGAPRPAEMEFAAVEALRGPAPDDAVFAVPAVELADPEVELNLLFPLSAVPPEGAIFLVGVLLPYLEQVARPAGSLPGTFADDGITGEYVTPPGGGGEQPWGYLIAPRADPDAALPPGDPAHAPDGLDAAEVEALVARTIAAANGTRAAIRLPAGSATKMVIAVTNLRGLVLAAYRMEDAPIFSLDVSVAKARAVTYFSSAPGQVPDIQPADVALLNAAGIPTGVPGSAGENGVALTTRSLGFLSQPFFPPGIDSSSVTPGPLFPLAAANADPAAYRSMASAPADPALRSGIIFFPGAAPLYRDGVLVGGIGVSGDGVEQDDFVTAEGVAGWEPPPGIRVDNFAFEGVTIPYFKFPQIPGPGVR